MKIQELLIPFGEFSTYVRIAGEGDRTPLILLHGGPGSTHNYFELLDSLGTNRMIISYDQLGCGNSYVENRPDLWTLDTWMSELDNIIAHLHLDHYHLLGQSWGGMLAIAHAVERKPKGLRSIILSSTLSDSQLWGQEQHRMIRFLPEEEQNAIRHAEENQLWDDPAYLTATEHYMKLHCADIQPSDPECLRRPKQSGTESYITAWGPNEYTPIGTLKDFNYTPRLHEINVPALIINGTDDLSTPLISKTMYDGIPNSRWELFPYARHMVFAEYNEEYCRLLQEWLTQNDESAG